MKQIEIPPLDPEKERALTGLMGLEALAPEPQGPPKELNNAIGDEVRPIGAWDIPAQMTDGRPYTSWDRTSWINKHQDELRARAAEIAVDMEQGLFPDWAKGKPFSRHVIADAMGWSATSSVLSFMKDPEFARVVEWERTKREANYRMSVSDARPILRVAVSALLLETCRRALESPRAFKNGELLDATRKYLELLGQMDGGGQKPKDVRTTVNVFLQQVNLLPAAARQKALGLFSNELKAISSIADRLDEAS